MSEDRRLHVVHTGRDGTLASTTEADLAEIFSRLAHQDRIVVHFHGGLVDQESGFAIADRLAPVYQEAGAYPVFFVWSSGVVDIVRNNLQEILQESIFKRVLRWVLRYSLGKIRQDDAARAAGDIPVPPLPALERELAALDRGAEPYDGVAPQGEVTEVSDAELARLEQVVAGDAVLRDHLTAVVGLPPEAGPGSRGGGSIAVGRETSRISPDVLEELTDRRYGSRAIVSTVALARKVGQVVVAVIGRFRAGSDHGLYCTVVEEVLRALYLADLGGALWQAIKQETRDTFEAATPPRGGALFLDGLEQLLVGGARPRITLVGHSTGAVFIESLLAELRRRRLRPTSAVPAEFRVSNVVYLAPASLFPQSWELLGHWADIAENFRMFSMIDEAERADHVVPGYPRSLLYLVSGVAERDGDRSKWMPLVGLARYHIDHGGRPLTGDVFEALPGIRDVRAFLTAEALQRRTVWSPTAEHAPTGWRARALRHGEFDDDPAVWESLQHLVRGA